MSKKTVVTAIWVLRYGRIFVTAFYSCLILFVMGAPEHLSNYHQLLNMFLSMILANVIMTVMIILLANRIQQHPRDVLRGKIWWLPI